VTSEALWAETGVAVLAAGIAGLETAARMAFRRRHREPFRPRPVIEYPYSDFIEPVDSPLTFRFKPGFTHPRIHINRLGLRGKDPDPTRPKTLLLLGESEIFGAKLPHDDELWSAQLQRRLDVLNPGIWSVINGGIPGYNTHQFGLLWDRLADEIPIDVLLLRIGINDISQAYAMGDNWHPDAPWPIEFIRLLERRQPTSAHWLWWSCVWQTLRRVRDDQAKARAFKSGEGVFQWEACRDLLRERIGRIVRDAQQRGIQVALLPPAPVFGPAALG
jgi:lysophospholipase L1-like esterase